MLRAWQVTVGCGFGLQDIGTRVLLRDFTEILAVMTRRIICIASLSNQPLCYRGLFVLCCE